MKRLVVNDALSQIPGSKTLWHLLCEWFNAEFIAGDYSQLAAIAGAAAQDATLVIRNCSYFGPIETTAPQIGILQDIFPQQDRAHQVEVLQTCRAVVFPSAFTRAQYCTPEFIANVGPWAPVIPLPVDFSSGAFCIQNRMGWQQFYGLPDGCVIWVGANREAGQVKGWDIFQAIARTNPDLHFVAVFKDDPPESVPPNMRAYSRVPQNMLAQIMNACRVGLCTSRMESQHLAGIEMGACGLPVVAPPVGVYWKREQVGVRLVDEPAPYRFSAAIRETLATKHDAGAIRAAWMAEFHQEIVRAKWAALIADVEGA